MTRAARQRKITPPPEPVHDLSPAELRERDQKVKALRETRASWRIGDTRDADNQCKCGSERVEELVDTSRGQLWVVRCLVCRPEVGK